MWYSSTPIKINYLIQKYDISLRSTSRKKFIFFFFKILSIFNIHIRGERIRFFKKTYNDIHPKVYIKWLIFIGIEYHINNCTPEVSNNNYSSSMIEV